MTKHERGTVLYGMMGAGKTTLGWGLGDRLQQPFVDTDHLIEAETGQTCCQLVEGGTFAVVQEEVLLAHRPEGPEVIATGGSVANFQKLTRHLAVYGVGIFLKRDPDELDAQLPQERKDALLNPDGLSFPDLYIARMPGYAAAAELTLEIPAGETPEVSLERLVEMRTTTS